MRPIPADLVPAVFRTPKAGPAARPTTAVVAAPPRPPGPALGIATPRIAPPMPVASLLDEYLKAARDLGIDLMPWQVIAARYMTAQADHRWQFRSVAVVVARQNGKTELLLPRILMGLRMGRRMLHTAQNRALPRETFLRIARILETLERRDPQLDGAIRYANGQEVIKFTNGGRYTLVAPRPGVRGNAVDDVFLDEVREQRSFDLIAGLKPTLTASRDPQIIYLSNAGDEASVVLNDLKRRADSDAALAYLEWSIPPDMALSDPKGWAYANPALGITIQPETLEDFHASLPSPVFETEHGCRWVITMRAAVVDPATWSVCRANLEKPVRPAMAISMDPSGTRASLVMAWQQTDGTVAMRVVEDVTGSPIDSEALGQKWREMASRLGATVGFDPWTDADMARNFRSTKPINGREYANASEGFARLVEQGRLRWDEADAVTDDLAWTARKPHESGAWMAVKAKEDRPIPSVFAAIRAVWLVSGPRERAPRVY